MSTLKKHASYLSAGTDESRVIKPLLYLSPWSEEEPINRG